MSVLCFICLNLYHLNVLTIYLIMNELQTLLAIPADRRTQAEIARIQQLQNPAQNSLGTPQPLDKKALLTEAAQYAKQVKDQNPNAKFNIGSPRQDFTCPFAADTICVVIGARTTTLIGTTKQGTLTTSKVQGLDKNGTMVEFDLNCNGLNLPLGTQVRIKEGSYMTKFDAVTMTLPTKVMTYTGELL